MKLKGKKFNNVLQVQQNLHQVHIGIKVKVKAIPVTGREGL
jgi:hypothetical protein